MPILIDHVYIPYLYLIKTIPSVIVGIIAVIILSKTLMNKHNDVKQAVGARLYTDGKIDFTVNKDSLVYVEEYSHYSPVISSSDSGVSHRSGGSSTHISSSGRTHGGRGGKF